MPSTMSRSVSSARSSPAEKCSPSPWMHHGLHAVRQSLEERLESQDRLVVERVALLRPTEAQQRNLAVMLAGERSRQPTSSGWPDDRFMACRMAPLSVPVKRGRGFSCRPRASDRPLLESAAHYCPPTRPRYARPPSPVGGGIAATRSCLAFERRTSSLHHPSPNGGGWPSVARPGGGCRAHVSA